MINRLTCAIFDWAGTLVDHGSLAPMGAFVETFAGFGVTITIAEARGPMGMAKRAHIAALMAQPRIAAAWEKKHNRAPSEADIDAVYEVFVPKNVAVAAKYATLIPGVVQTVATLRGRGVKIGSTTGYTREIMDQILPVAAEQGLDVDSLVCTGDTPQGRPTPFMVYRTLLDLGIWPAWRAVKIDDTEVGIAEGLNAGSWTVGVAMSGNVMGLSRADLEALPAGERATRREDAYGRLHAAGAHFVIDSVADLIPVIDEINGRLARGQRP